MTKKKALFALALAVHMTACAAVVMYFYEQQQIKIRACEQSGGTFNGSCLRK